MIGLLGKTTRDRRPDIESAVRGIAESATVVGVVGALEAMLERPDSTPMLSSVSVPTLIVVGEEDVLTPPKEARAMHAPRQEVTGGHDGPRGGGSRQSLSEFGL